MAKLWTFVDPVETMPNGAEPKHMTWACCYMMPYLIEEVTSVIVGGFNEKITPKGIWLFIDAIIPSESSGDVFNLISPFIIIS